MAFKHSKFTSPRKFFVWLVIALYVWCLPWAILFFNFLENLLSLSVARWMPVAVLLFAFSYLYLISRRRTERPWLKHFFVPSLVLAAIVFGFQSNPIKYIHILEYAVLSLLVWRAQSNGSVNTIQLLSVVFSVTLLGTFDEIHQGIHPARYFGWKDMVVNMVGGIIGVLWIRVAVSNVSSHRNPANIGIPNIVVALISIVVLIFSFVQLLAVQSTGSFAQSYPNYLLIGNLLMVVAGALISVIALRPNNCMSNTVLAPILIASVVHGFIVFAALSSIPFR